LEQKAIELSNHCLYAKDGTVTAVIDKDPRYAILIDLNKEPLFCGCGYIEKGQLLCEHIVAGCYAIENFDALTKQEIFFKNESAKEAQRREYNPIKGTKKNETNRCGSSVTRQHPSHANEYLTFVKKPRAEKIVVEEREDGELSSDDNTEVMVFKEPQPKPTTEAQLKPSRPKRIREGQYTTLAPSMHPTTPFASNTTRLRR
jgi:hypothetical protein